MASTEAATSKRVLPAGKGPAVRLQTALPAKPAGKPGMRPRRSVTVMWEQAVSGASPSRRIHIFATRADRITCIPYRTPCLSLKACLNCSKSPAPMCRGSDLRRPIPVAAAQTVWKSCRHPTGYHPAAFTLRRSSSADRVAGCGNKDWSATGCTTGSPRCSLPQFSTNV